MRKILSLFGLAMLCTLFATAQVHPVTGKVTDNKGEPVPFATVKVKDSKQAVSADANGVYQINVSTGTTLIVTSIGFGTKEIVVKGNVVNASLVKATEDLSEVVVTALGQVKSKAKVGYSTSTFSSDAITKNAAVGLLDNIAGKVAGADISNIGGPGASTKVVLRGYGVIAGGNNQPLYVIDGVPLYDGRPGSVNRNLDFGNGLNSINPNDVESITILKGTAASSLYGGVAKNGAIMITTKKGKAGKLKIEYSGSANFSTVGKLPDLQSEFGQGWSGVFVLSENGSWGPKLDGQKRLWGAIVDNSQLIKQFSAIKDNIRKFYDIGNEVNNTIALSGGNEATRFYFSYGNTFSDGVVPTKSDYLERHTFALRTNSNFNNFSINTSFNYVNKKQNAPNTGQAGSDGGGVFQSLLQIPVDIPITDFKNYKNKFFNVDNYFSPYAENPYYGLYENGDQQKSDRFFGNVDMNYKFSQHFNVEYRLGGDFMNARTTDWKQPNAPSAGSWNAGANVEGASRTADVGSFAQGSDYSGIINMDFLLKYNKDLNKDFNLDAIGGANYYQLSTTSVFTTITNLTIPGFFNLSNTSLPPTTTDVSNLRRRVGLYAQATVGYKSQLFLTGNIRNDWSSTLPIDHNSTLYPGGSLSWIASNTMNLNKTPISFLKFRAAYGRTGSDPVPYDVYPTLTPGGVSLGIGSLTSPFNGVSAFRISNTLANLNLKPILTDEFEFGAEIKLFKDRIGIDAAYYDKKTIGQIFTVPIAPSTGYTGLVQNLGTTSNKGIELAVTAKPIDSKSLTWSLTYTYSKNWNNVDNLNGGQQNPLLTSAYDAELRAVVGKSVASIYAPVPQLTTDGKTVVDASTGFPSLNKTPLDKYGMTKGYYGSGLYDYMMGLVNTITYKNFQLSGSLDFRSGGVMYSQTADLVLFTGNGIATTYNDRKPFIVPNSVNVNGVDASGKPIYTENKTFIGATGAGQTDNTFGYYYPSQNQGSAYSNRIFDRSFLKLRDINLSYTLPKSWASKIKANNISLGVYGRNFILWTPKANVYVDPEATNLGNDINGQLGEFSSAPISKQFGVILRATF